jgi:cytochrome c oxidase assembly protein subunit 15
VITLFLTFDLVLFGTFTRLTDSGLGCPDWPGCYGNASPLGASEAIDAAQSARPTGPVTHGKAWVEMVHRYLATAVVVLITVLALARWRAWRRRPGDVAPGDRWWATATLVWVCIQGAFGALTVTMQLYPAIVTLHLLGGMVLLGLLAAQAQSAPASPMTLTKGLRRGLAAVFAMSVAQIALGGWVSTNYAVLACTDFPVCQGAWWPPMDFREGFAILRPLGEAQDGGWLPFAALTAIHYTHRLAAAIVLPALGWFAWRLHLHCARHGGGGSRAAAWLAGIALWQLATGLSNVVLGWPLVAAVGHTAGAAALIVVLTSLSVRVRQASRLAGAPAQVPPTRSLEATRLHHV